MTELLPTTLFQHTVLESEHGARIDAMLALLLNSYSRVFLRKVVQEQHARVDGEVVKPSFRVRAGQQIEVDLATTTPAGWSCPRRHPAERHLSKMNPC